MFAVRRTGVMLAVVMPGWLAGCGMPPTNQVRLTGSQALDPSGKYPQMISLRCGEFVIRDGAASAVLVGPGAAILMDCRGPNNRFELMLRHDSQTILYQRLTQRPPAKAGATLITQPAGVRIDREDPCAVVTFDVVVGRVDEVGFGPAFEHYPRHIRVRGRIASSRRREARGPTTQAAAFWLAPTSASSAKRLPSLADVDDGWLMGPFANDLPQLSSGGGANKGVLSSLFGGSR